MRVRASCGVVDTYGALQIGKDATLTGSYLISGSTGSLNVRALDIGDKGTLGFTFDAAGVTWSISQVSADTLFTFSNGATLTLANVNMNDLVAIDSWHYG